MLENTAIFIHATLKRLDEKRQRGEFLLPSAALELV